jgi:hypothetical protein
MNAKMLIPQHFSIHFPPRPFFVQPELRLIMFYQENVKGINIHTKKSVAALLATMMLTVSGGTAMAVEKDTTIKNVCTHHPACHAV